MRSQSPPRSASCSKRPWTAQPTSSASQSKCCTKHCQGRSVAVKMREHVDATMGNGAWDRMHDLIAVGRLDGWTLPPMVVDGVSVSLFPGSNREVTVEEVEAEVRKCIDVARHTRGAGS